MKTVLRLMAALCVMAACCVGGYYGWFVKYQQPTVRSEVAEPLYTVDAPSVALAIAEGKTVVEYGPLPGSAFYAGSLAFRQPEEAFVWLKNSGKLEEGWRVYELSGDFTLDTHLIRGLCYTNKTLQVCREIPAQP